jgi:uncharacterized protein with HEPN domain
VKCDKIPSILKRDEREAPGSHWLIGGFFMANRAKTESKNTDQVRLRHMLEFSREAVRIARRSTRGDLNRRPEIRFALERLVGSVCEAASCVPRGERSNYPEIQWKQIVGMRQKLIHAYYNVDLDRVWDTVVDDFPTLIGQLTAILRRRSAR